MLALLLTVSCSGDENSGPNADSSTEPSHTIGTDAGVPDASREATATTAVTGPISGGKGQAFSTSVVDLKAHGYTEKEFFFEGEASAYALPGEMTPDGKWTLTEASKKPFKSRLLVRRPADAAKFNGTVVVEWLNVSGGADGDPGYMYNYEEILREGYAWVGVSAQIVGVQGGGFSLLAGMSGVAPLREHDPERYGSLNHPGDDYSFDIYTRAGKIVRQAGALDVLDGLKPKRLIAYGESQSAGRLVSYVNGVHPLVKVYDGFFIHSRGAGGPAFTTSEQTSILPSIGTGTSVRIRDDLAEPVFQFQTETDVHGMLAFLGARQPDTDRLRTWEVAGTAHADTHILEVNENNPNAPEGGSVVSCEGANDGPQHLVIKAALHAMNRWLVEGTPPPRGALLMVDAAGNPITDQHGNTLGGIRSPAVDVPIAALRGEPVGSGGFDITRLLCNIFGSTEPFSPEKLMQLYPTHDDYVMKVTQSARAAKEAGFLLEPEVQVIVAEASAAPIPK